MHPYGDKREVKERSKNPKFCIACFRERDGVPVDKHHVCKDCRQGSTGVPKRLRAVTLKNGKTYFVDNRLGELRNIRDPGDRIELKDLDGANLLA